MILLDTVTFLWIITGSKELSVKAKKIYLDRNNKIYLSSASLWEMIVKHKLGRLPLPGSPSQYLTKQRLIHGIDSLSIEENDVFELEKLPSIHNDPFDRMLICQAKARNLTILTPDKIIHSYPVLSTW